MSHNGLKLNEDKTEWIIFNGCDISENVTLTVGAHSITQSTHIRSLGVRLDAELTIEPQITDMCKTAYYHIKKGTQWKEPARGGPCYELMSSTNAFQPFPPSGDSTPEVERCP